MTVIVAARTKDGFTMAADRCVTGGWQKHHHEEPKLWVSGKWAFGAAGGLREAQVLKHHVDWPVYRPDEETGWEEFLVKRLVPAIRNGVQGHGVMISDNGSERLGNAAIIAATGDRFAVVDSWGCVFANDTGRDAIGSGSPQALGALRSKGPWTEADVIKATRVAAETAVGVDDRISVVNTKTLTVRTLGMEEAA